MRDIRFIEREEGVRQAVCAHCGGEATWNFADEQETTIDMLCPDCGRFQMTRAQFDEAESDIAGPEERSE
ncbi:MAG TPA: hypothetical protein VHB50_07140 [Bryobacteraceae bacterium]|jgi:hypothetical protein|nr:hypothetical protein [Bryobacteraceae bacterium]